MQVTVSCLDCHPRKFICEKLQNDQASQILYLKFPIIRYPIDDFHVNVIIRNIAVTVTLVGKAQNI